MTDRRTDAWNPRAAFAASLVGFIEVIRINYLARLPTPLLVQNTPDDAFYYLQAARNFARLGRWSFDGIEPTSGYHLLWGYLLALWFRIWPTLTVTELFVLSGLLQSACLATAAFLITRTGERLAGKNACWGVLVIFLSATSLLQGTWMMETCFVILCSAIILTALTRTSASNSCATLCSSFFLGVLTSVARSDAGVPAFLFLFAHIYLWYRGRSTHSMITQAAMVCSGTIIGVGLVVLNTHQISGRWLQASAQEKVFWTRVIGPSFSGPLRIVLNFFNPFYNAAAAYSSHEKALDGYLHPIHHHLYVESILIAGILLMGMATGLVVHWRSNPSAVSVLSTLIPGCVLIAYIVVYRFGSAGVQGWYVANFEAPFALLAAVGFSSVVFRATKIAPMVLGAMFLAGISCSFVAPFPWAESMWRAAEFLSREQNTGPVGAWNAGILGFVSDTGVINLDGLMNDTVVPFTQRGDLVDYLSRRKVRFLLDSPQMLDENSSMLGGYPTMNLQRCIVGNRDLFPDDHFNNFGNDHIRLYTLDANCLAIRD